MKSHKGFGLLEILITLVLLGVGVAGLVAMSRGILGTSQDGRRYEVAMRLAESKIDEFRTFNGVVSAVSPLTAYNSIAAGSSTTTPTNGGGSYSLSWTVSNQYWNGTGWSTTAPAGYLYTYPGRKVINVTVGWSDSAGQARSLLLSGAVAPVESLATNQMQGGGLDTSRKPPQVNYQPGVAPDVISIEIDQDGRKQETSKPLPEIYSQKGEEVGKLVQFDTVTYLTDGGDSTKQVLQDLATVSCSCSTSGSTASAYLPGQAYFSNDGQRYWSIGSKVTKKIGTSNSSDQPTLCNLCCEHHFDGPNSSFEQFYAPLDSARKRYDKTLNLVAGNGNYIDACRFVRIDGYYRPIPDWNLVKMVVTSADFLAKTANQKSYENYIKYVVGSYVEWQKNTLRWSPSASISAPVITDFNVWLQNNAESGGDTSIDINMNSGATQLVARGIYVDIMNPSYLADVDTNATDYLARVPFQDINLTMLTEWSVINQPALAGGTSSYVDVTNEAIKTLTDADNYYFGRYSRGYIVAKKATKDSNGNLHPVSIRAVSYQGNSGVTATLVSTRDQSQALSAGLGITVDTGVVAGTTITVSGKVECLQQGSGNNAPPVACKNNIYSNLRVNTITSGANCVIVPPTGTNQIAYYRCTAPEYSTLVISFTYTNKNNTTFQLNPNSLSIVMEKKDDSQSISGPCTLLVDNGVSNAANLTCSPPPPPSP